MLKPFVLRGIELLLLVVTLSRCVHSESSPSLPIQPPPSVSSRPATLSQSDSVRQIADNVLPLREYWRISYEYITGSDDTPGLLAIAEYVIFHTFGQGVYGQLRILEAQSGVLVWEKSQVADGAETLAVDNERVYFANRMKLYAYTLDDGELLWEQSLPSNVNRMYVDGERLQMCGYVERQPTYLEFDIHTGEQISSTPEHRTDGRLVALPYPSFILLQLPDYQMRAVARDTQQVLWTASWGRGPVIRRPFVLDNLLVSTSYLAVWVADLRTGQIKWENGVERPSASNFAFAGDFAYNLDLNARLIRWEVRTGKDTGYMAFTPPNTAAPGKWYPEKPYWVAADGEMVFVAFGDTHELIALGP